MGSVPADSTQPESVEIGAVDLFLHRKCTLIDLCDRMEKLSEDHAGFHFQFKEIREKLLELHCTCKGILEWVIEESLQNEDARGTMKNLWVLMARENEEEKEVVIEETTVKVLEKEKKRKKYSPYNLRTKKRKHYNK